MVGQASGIGAISVGILGGFATGLMVAGLIVASKTNLGPATPVGVTSVPSYTTSVRPPTVTVPEQALPPVTVTTRLSAPPPPTRTTVVTRTETSTSPPMTTARQEGWTTPPPSAPHE